MRVVLRNTPPRRPTDGTQRRENAAVGARRSGVTSAAALPPARGCATAADRPAPSSSFQYAHGELQRARVNRQAAEHRVSVASRPSDTNTQHAAVR